MEFNKKEILRNLKALEAVIAKKDNMIRNNSDISAELRAECYEDLMFIRGLMDDIECNRITEFPMVERTNLMSGRTYLEDEDTPRSCSPASELYWSM